MNSNKKDSLDQEIELIQSRFHIIGRKKELKHLLIALKAGKHVLLEGEVGVGKTFLARALAQYFDTEFYRVDGSEDVLSHVLVGYFDPPLLIQKGYVEEAFIYGPLSLAMQNGGCLFINELNRIPESTQNVLLSALDERILTIPKLKELRAEPKFMTIATQNPSAHVGVSALGEALKDRFIWIHIEYQSEEEEKQIIQQNLVDPDFPVDISNLSTEQIQKIIDISVAITRNTRSHPHIRRGASVRGAIDLAQLVATNPDENDQNFWYDATIMALQPKIELMDGIDRSAKEILHEIVDMVFRNF